MQVVDDHPSLGDIPYVQCGSSDDKRMDMLHDSMLDRFVGCLFGGSVGDVLGSVVEVGGPIGRQDMDEYVRGIFYSTDGTIKRFPAKYTRDVDVKTYGRFFVTDDTQLTAVLANSLAEDLRQYGVAADDIKYDRFARMLARFSADIGSHPMAPTYWQLQDAKGIQKLMESGERVSEAPMDQKTPERLMAEIAIIKAQMRPIRARLEEIRKIRGSGVEVSPQEQANLEQDKKDLQEKLDAIDQVLRFGHRIVYKDAFKGLTHGGPTIEGAARAISAVTELMGAVTCRGNESSFGNGSVMRAPPIGLYYAGVYGAIKFNVANLIADAIGQSTVTHKNGYCLLMSAVVTYMTYSAVMMGGKTPTEAQILDIALWVLDTIGGTGWLRALFHGKMFDYGIAYDSEHQLVLVSAIEIVKDALRRMFAIPLLEYTPAPAAAAESGPAGLAAASGPKQVLRPASAISADLATIKLNGESDKDGPWPLSAHAVKTGWAIRCFAAFPWELSKVVACCIAPGGDTDTCASIGGALCGAFEGFTKFDGHASNVVMHLQNIGPTGILAPFGCVSTSAFGDLFDTGVNFYKACVTAADDAF